MSVVRVSCRLSQLMLRTLAYRVSSSQMRLSNDSYKSAKQNAAEIVHRTALSQANNGMQKDDTLKTAEVIDRVTLQVAKANNDQHKNDATSASEEERDVNTVAKTKRYQRYLSLLHDDVAARHEAEERRVRLVPKQDEIEKVSLMKRVWKEIAHYVHGFRLFCTEFAIACRLLKRMVQGQSLLRKERKQLERTLADCVRMVPFVAFILIPMAEFALPFYLKLFPNALPSTFSDERSDMQRRQKVLEQQIEHAKFLLRTLEEAPLMKNSDGDKSMTKEFKRLMRKIEEEGGYVSNADLFKFVNYFREELTLDNFSVSQLRAMCKLLQVRILPLSTPETLRLQLHLTLNKLRADDEWIVIEGGVEALSFERLAEACRERGMRVYGMSEARLRAQLQQWLELSRNEQVPEAMLLLSRAMYFPEDVKFEDRLKKLLPSLPQSAKKIAEQRLAELEGGKVDYRERRSLILELEKMIKEEREAQTKIEEEAKQKTAAEKAEKERQEQERANKENKQDSDSPDKVEERQQRRA